MIVRQSKFRLDGTITDEPAKNLEEPQLENQSDIFTYAKEKENLKIWEGENEQ